MYKLYYPSPDELQGAEPLPEKAWFKKYQYWLLRLANTNEGRDVLYLPPWRTHPYPIVELRKQVVKFYLGRGDTGERYQSEFHIGAKWGNVIRSRWLEVQKAINRTLLRSILDYPPVYTKDGRLLPMIGGAEHELFYPEPSGSEDNSIDAVTYRYVGGAGTSFLNLRDNAGTGYQTDSPVDDMGRAYTSTTSGNWQAIHRQFYLFYTASLGNDDTIDSGTMTLTSNPDVMDSFGDDTVLTDSDPESLVDVVASDYQRMENAVEQATNRIDVGLFGTDGATHVYTLTSDAGKGINIISKTGTTKLGGRVSCDQDRDEPDTWVSSGQSTPRHYASETAGTSKDPKLTILHTSPFTPQVIII